jgi:hypothetical protein
MRPGARELAGVGAAAPALLIGVTGRIADLVTLTGAETARD